ncbi:ACP5 [Symbiodinium necroappetens]|uniref:ACP5 protein n=1 Tax=Symbiodinium necroappetens TaxID=1628268 RepID=A0A812WRW2_9DINO|nr:ACP5 [Symbiodinium necroappetens]
MSCSCWDDSKKDGQILTLDLGSNQQVAQLKLYQGGSGNEWAVKRVRLHCHESVAFSSALSEPLELDVSTGVTTIDCSDQGCTTALDPAYYDTCKGVGAKLASGLAAVLAVMLLPILLASWSVLPSGGDGPLVTSTSTPTNVVSDSNPNICNPFRGYRYISIGAAGGISSSSCYASWDVHEVEAFTSSGQLTLSASSMSGSDDGYPPSKAVDGDSGSFWAGDHDVGMSCSCWDDSKKDGQILTLDLGSNQQVTQLKLYQGGNGNDWAVKRVRLHCHESVAFSSALSEPLELEVSTGVTTIDCSDQGCTADLQPAYYDTCAGTTSNSARVAVGVAAAFSGVLLL